MQVAYDKVTRDKMMTAGVASAGMEYLLTKWFEAEMVGAIDA